MNGPPRRNPITGRVGGGPPPRPPGRGGPDRPPVPPPDDDGPRWRRALSHVGGRTVTAGEPDAAAALADALAVAPSTDDEADPARLHVHGFHTYPARMHPATAARLVRAFTRPGDRVLDPFCGSGTVLVEAMVLGRRPLGTDLNPLAVRLARCKVRVRPPDALNHLRDAARACADHAHDRRRAKAGATRRFPLEDTQLFEPHVLLELDSLRAAVEERHDDPAQADLWLVLSAVLVKLSRLRGDTSGFVTTKRSAPGYATRLFVEKADDLAARLAALAAFLPPGERPAPLVVEDDATQLRRFAPASADAVITSPPYAGTYDYLAHHELRLRWLGLDAGPLARGELGGRSAYERVPPAEAAHLWADEVGRFLSAVRRVLLPGAPVVLLMADSAVNGAALRADEITADVARRCGFYPAAVASQPRPHFHSPTAGAYQDRERFEHAILLRRV